VEKLKTGPEIGCFESTIKISPVFKCIWHLEVWFLDVHCNCFFTCVWIIKVGTAMRVLEVLFHSTVMWETYKFCAQHCQKEN
jgi:hypothetical protein